MRGWTEQRWLWAMAAVWVHAAPAAASEAPLGLWLSAKKALLVELAPCTAGDDTLCGHIVWLKKTHRKDGSLRLDDKNPDPALRDRPWCGIRVIEGLRPASEGRWDGGTVYDPKRGEEFNLVVETRSDGRLKMRGFVGIELLGRTEIWTRPEPDTPRACAAG